MTGRAIPLLLLALAMPAQAATGTGWTRASDLSVYQAMDAFGDLAREQRVLCRGKAAARVAAEWSQRFGAREARVADALSARYGPSRVSVARTFEGERQPCEPAFTNRWAEHHARLLRVLELRLFDSDVRTRG